jgi:hypothetical protein
VTHYAEKTIVPVERTRGEIEATLKRYGATRFLVGWDEHETRMGFEYAAYRFEFLMTAPKAEDLPKNTRNPQTALAKLERQRWRALLLVIKAKLEAVASGISTIEQEFLAHMVMPDGQILGHCFKPLLLGK